MLTLAPGGKWASREQRWQQREKPLKGKHDQQWPACQIAIGYTRWQGLALLWRTVLVQKPGSSSLLLHINDNRNIKISNWSQHHDMDGVNRWCRTYLRLIQTLGKGIALKAVLGKYSQAGRESVIECYWEWISEPVWEYAWKHLDSLHWWVQSTAIGSVLESMPGSVLENVLGGGLGSILRG